MILQRSELALELAAVYQTERAKHRKKVLPLWLTMTADVPKPEANDSISHLHFNFNVDYYKIPGLKMCRSMFRSKYDQLWFCMVSII